MQRPQGRDLVAGLTVALVLIPQSLAYATLAGLPPVVGLSVGAVATLAAAPFVSSPFLQTGPVAITALMTFGALSGLAAPTTPSYVALAALLAVLIGVIRLAVGLAGAGTLAYLMSEPVLSGFTPAAALVIAVGQLPDMVGIDATGRGPIDALAAVADLSSWTAPALGLAIGTVAIVLAGRRIHQLFPGVLVAVIAGILVSELTGFDGRVVGTIPMASPQLALGLPWDQFSSIILAALVIALVGFAEPAAIARTYAQQTRTSWDSDREFVGQGVANLAAGFFSGFPVGGSFSRSAVARAAGARTEWTGAITGLVVLAFLPAVRVLEDLPLAVLGAVIFSSVLSLVRLRPVWRLRRWSRQQFVVALATFALTLVTAPQVHVALIVGISLSIVAHLRRELVLAAPHWVDGATLHVRPLGVLYFGSAHQLEDHVTDLLSGHRETDTVVLHLDRLGRVDVTGALALRELAEHLTAAHVRMCLVDLTPTSRKIITRVMPGELIRNSPDQLCPSQDVGQQQLENR